MAGAFLGRTVSHIAPRNLSIVSKRDSENSPEYSEFLCLCGNHWCTASHVWCALCSQLLEELEEPQEEEEVRMSILDEDFKQTAGEIIDAFEEWLKGVPEWQIEEPNHEGLRVMVLGADGAQTGWLLLRASLHDPLLVVNAESDVEGGASTAVLPAIS